jgi:hypothetical protein
MSYRTRIHLPLPIMLTSTQVLGTLTLTPDVGLQTRLKLIPSGILWRYSLLRALASSSTSLHSSLSNCVSSQAQSFQVGFSIICPNRPALPLVLSVRRRDLNCRFRLHAVARHSRSLSLSICHAQGRRREQLALIIRFLK